MADDFFNFGQTELFDAEAVGQPGNRRFRLFARNGNATASFWLEREQFEALAVALDQMLAQFAGGMVLRPEAMGDLPKPPGAPADFPASPEVEFRVGQIQLGYSEDDDTVLLRLAPLEMDEENGTIVPPDEVEVRFAAEISRAQAERLSLHIRAVLAGGRPRCPFCGRPMEGGHVCEKQNGYHPVGLN